MKAIPSIRVNDRFQGCQRAAAKKVAAAIEAAGLPALVLTVQKMPQRMARVAASRLRPLLFRSGQKRRHRAVEARPDGAQQLGLAADNLAVSGDGGHTGLDEPATE